MFVVKVYCKIETCLDLTVNFHHEHCIVPTICPWVSEDDSGPSRRCASRTGLSYSAVEWVKFWNMRARAAQKNSPFATRVTRELAWGTTYSYGAIHLTKIRPGKVVHLKSFFRNFSGWTDLIHWVLDRNFWTFGCLVLWPVDTLWRRFCGCEILPKPPRNFV